MILAAITLIFADCKHCNQQFNLCRNAYLSQENLRHQERRQLFNGGEFNLSWISLNIVQHQDLQVILKSP